MKLHGLANAAMLAVPMLLAWLSTTGATVPALSARDMFLTLEQMGPEGAVNTTLCYASIAAADDDGSMQIELDEYIGFMKSLSEDDTFLAGVDELSDLPFTQTLGFVSNFNLLSCLCENNITTSCCSESNDRGISIAGAGSGEEPTPEQEEYLGIACRFTTIAIENFLSSFPPTEPPTAATFAPTVSPTASPTARPTEDTSTQSPTSRPTAAPTGAPTTSSPTSAPTVKLSSQPTGVPTANPTDAPTIVQSMEPTGSPTSAPTGVPSSTPTSVPSSTPSSNPTPEPTTSAPTSPTDTLEPTPLASETPTALPTVTTAAPTSAPTAGPTDMPSIMPTTSSPTSGPTPMGSSAPSASPTSAPTQQPSASPTSVPTASPSSSSAPSFAGQTRAPTTSPSVSPTAVPSTSPSAAAQVTSSPTLAPTDGPLVTTVEASADYQIGVVDGASGNVDPSTYNQDLITTMDRLSAQVLSDLDFNRRLRRLAAGRRLQSVNVPTGDPVYTDTECPDDVNSSFLCRNVTAPMILTFNEGETSNPEQSGQEFEVALLAAINSGEMQNTLDGVNANSNIVILNGRDDRILAGGGSSNTIGGGAVAGIVVGSVVFLGIILLLLTRRRGDDEEADKPAYELEPAPQGVSIDDEESMATSPTRSIAAPQQQQRSSPGVLGAGTPNYGQIPAKRPDDAQQLSKVDPRMTEPQDDHDSSSNAGSSGWSSSAGVSSLNTGSADGLGFDDDSVGIAGATSLAAIGAASYQKNALDTETSQPSQGSVTRTDLDSAIEAGDWAAVGATAAILAAASDSQSYSSQSGALSGGASLSQSGTSYSSLDAARAAELDHLVDAGDWEGVVLAAAKYEAAEGSTSAASQSQSVVSGSERSSESGTGESGTYRSASVSGSMGSTPSKALRRQELKAQVEELVLRVVPEEINNVDEMMLQFRGREEELVETLRTMQERAVAQKARQTSQRAAKAEAKKQVKAARAAPSVSGAAEVLSLGAAATTALASQSRALDMGGGRDGSERSSNDSSESSKGAGQFPNVSSRSLGTGQVARPPVRSSAVDERERRQSALERAIEDGDWEAVSEAAALMSEGSVTSADTDEINRLASGVMSDASSAGTSKGGNSERAAELDELIDKGDWTGVVAAASRYSSTDVADGKTSAEEIEERRQRRMKRMQEEEDALKQAEIWMAIAEQSKQDSEQEAKGASEAADWAIARSLSLLVEQEQSGAMLDTDDDDQKPPGTNDSDQEEV